MFVSKHVITPTAEAVLGIRLHDYALILETHKLCVTYASAAGIVSCQTMISDNYKLVVACSSTARAFSGRRVPIGL